MLKRQLYLLFVLLLAFPLYMCGSSESPFGDSDDIEQPVSPDADEALKNQGWRLVTDRGNLPEYIRVYKSPAYLEGVLAEAYVAVADMSEAKFEVLGNVGYSKEAGGYVADKLKTPSEFYENSGCSIITNAGLFFTAVHNGERYAYTQNLVVRNGDLLAPNQNFYSKNGVTWYPTIGTFCQWKDGTFEAVWTYAALDGKTYVYPQPADNDVAKVPLERPSAAFPAGGKALDAVNAIGGIIVLVHEGKIVNSYTEEMFGVSPTSNAPRTAIGVTADNRLVLLVCEGRNMTAGVAGFTTDKLAAIMKRLGCVEALNLDGGGSSCMLVNGHETIKCSDGKQRKVLTAIGLK